MSSRTKHLVVTGAGGFIGKKLVDRALERGWRVTAIIRQDTGKPDPLPSNNLEFFKWDLLDQPAKLADVFRDGVDLLCHLAAFIPPDLSSSSYADQCFKANALATLRLFEFCKGKDIGKLIYCSSGNIYKPSGGLSRETDLLYPASRGTYYLTSKLAGEIYVENLRQHEPDRYATLRIGSVYGPGMKKSGLGAMLAGLMKEEKVDLYNGGRFAADFVYVDDVVESFFLAGEHHSGGIYNIGSGVTTTLYDLMSKAVDMFGKSNCLLNIIDPEDNGSAAESGFNGLDISKASEVLGYRPTGLEDGLKKYWEHYNE